MLWPNSLRCNAGPATRRVCPARFVCSLLGSHQARQKTEFCVHETSPSAAFADREDELQASSNEAVTRSPPVWGRCLTT